MITRSNGFLVQVIDSYLPPCPNDHKQMHLVISKFISTMNVAIDWNDYTGSSFPVDPVYVVAFPYIDGTFAMRYSIAHSAQFFFVG